ncbi:MULTISPECIES: ArsR/SmtB family transcription factor [unclassified Methanoculleus]|jgi:ArsR family transcriptional regulator|uniref:ArsR/SmtB family transcription factor n=1 Tax=unclassified Methanoculleus TaxID=2619537 RepID=UPI0025F7B1D6|nr:ArsR family transcriptional regulator [Methanoculleus sp. UBA377]MDD2473062.1 ArsR family transcriptional regulator [Methanoculleus sp.]
MLEGSDVSRLLDILGNRNRRRIIELLRQKPCFVTEISERLLLSPKAVIEHLQLMEREELLVSCQDERRRKYYYLSQDINVIVNLQKQDGVMLPSVEEDQETRFMRNLTALRRMVRARDELLDNLEQLEREIESRFDEVLRTKGGFLTDDGDLDIILPLSHADLTFVELEEVSSLSTDELKQRLSNLVYTGVVEQVNNRYRIRGTHGE